MCKSDLNTAEVRDSAQSVCGEREESDVDCAPHTPLTMCSVKLVDCRTVEPIPPVTNNEEEEDGEPSANDEDVIPHSVSLA